MTGSSVGVVPERIAIETISAEDISVKERTSAEEPIRIGLSGHAGSGKRSLFRALYRMVNGPGAPSPLVSLLGCRKAALFELNESGLPVAVPDFSSKVSESPVPPDYFLELHYRMGMFGFRRGRLHIECHSGLEQHHRGGIVAGWQAEIHCVPAWAVFPVSTPLPSDYEAQRGRILSRLRADLEFGTRIHSDQRLVALTMIDHPLSALTGLKERWVDPWLADPKRHIDLVRRGSGLMRYLQSAREASEYLGRELRRDPWQSHIPSVLSNGGMLKFVPVAARTPETAVHADLPILLAFCETTNVLI